MYLGCRVKIPRDGGNITVKTINGTPYVYIERGRSYSKEKKYSIVDCQVELTHFFVEN